MGYPGSGDPFGDIEDTLIARFKAGPRAMLPELRSLHRR